MAEFISVSTIKNTLTECPICTEQFDEDSRAPRRMPCCVQSICQPCLETYLKGRPTMSCPLCRHQHHLPGGIKSLPKEPLILKILDHLKIQKGVHLPCTDCPDHNDAIARCEECCISLCQECLNAHKRVRSLRDHKIITFEEMKDHPVESFRHIHLCKEHNQPLQFYCYTCEKVICVSCTVVDHERVNGHNVVSVDKAYEEKTGLMEDMLSKLDKQEEKLQDSLEQLKKKKNTIISSCEKTKYETNEIFDNLIKELQVRKTTLLSSIENTSQKQLKETEEALSFTETLAAQVKSSIHYTREMRTKADKIEDLRLIASSEESFKTMQNESTALKDVLFAEIQLDVDQTQIQEICALVKKLGKLQTVTRPTSKTDMPPQDEQKMKSEIQELMKKPLKEGDTWYLVDITWFKKWEKCITGEVAQLGPIDNSSLLEANGELKEHLVDDLEYELLPEKAWVRLFSSYGIFEGQNPISRKVIQQGMFVKHCKVEVYLLTLKLCYYTDINSFVNQDFSRSDSIADLEKTMRTVYNIAKEKEVRLWNRYMSSTLERLNKPKDTLQEAGLYQGQVIVIEEKNASGSWTMGKK